MLYIYIYTQREACIYQYIST